MPIHFAAQSGRFQRPDPHSSRRPRIIAQMRIKNEERWLQQVLDSIARVADGIVILDDGSTDRTPDICKAHPAVLDYAWQDEPVQDQVRDKNRHLRMALAFDPDWILSMDGDEILEESASERIREAIRRCPPDVSTFCLEFLYMWNDLRHYRVDGPYARIFHPRLFRLAGQDVANLTFSPTHFHGNGHCKSVPGNLLGRQTEVDVKVLHLGYMYPEVRQQRYERYRRRDPREFARGDYEHLLDQPGMQIVEWHERPYRESLPETRRSEPNVPPVKQELKPDYYYANARRNLADLVPASARRVLDVGCGQGLTGGLLRAERGIEVIGIEIHPPVAEEARKHLSEVIVGDLETMNLPFGDGYFDAILLGDVLEHLLDPWQALQKLTRCLHPDGTIVASLPNVRNLGVIGKLLEGSWKYEEWGILDQTHLRFFALKDMLALFERAGIEAEVAEVVRDPLFEKAMQSPPDQPTDLDLGGLVLRQISPQDLNELTAQQFIFRGRLKAAARPTASVIIPVYGNLEYTRHCITSLFAVKEQTPFEIIIVDDASTDGTAEYLRELGGSVRTVSMPENSGFAKACNAGAKTARGEYLVFLNNDTEVLPGWLDAMLACQREDPAIGLVGNLQIYPDTGRVQQAGIVCGENHIVRSLYNNELPADHPAVNTPREFQFVAGSCMLIGRDLFGELGGFDEGYLNSCEDIDLCLKVRAAGRKVFYCPRSRILHYESKTVKGHDKNGANYQRLLSRWRDHMVRDDLDYLRADGFLPDDPKDKLMITPEQAATPVAILTTYNQHCGLATYAEYLVHALREQGVRPLVLAECDPHLRGPEEPDVIRCWTRARHGGREIAALLQRHGVRVLHVNHGGMFDPNGWLEELLTTVRAMGVRIVITFHSTETTLESRGRLARLADRILVHQPQNTIELTALGAPVDRFEVVPHGMPPLSANDIFEDKLALGWNPARMIVSTFGFVEPHKGILELIEAMPAICKEQGADLHVLGGGHPHNPDSGRYFEQCKAKARELGIEQSVHFAEGFLPEEDVVRRLRASDVIVMNYCSHRYESSGAAMIALAAGRPVVTSSAPSFDYPLALTFKTTHEFSLTEAIRRTLTNPFIGMTLLRNVREYEQTARWDRVAARIRGIYEAVLAEPPRCELDILHWYRSHPDDIYAEPLQRERVRWLKSKAEGRILEIGPANGYVSQFVGAAAAVDINRGRLAVASTLRPDVKFESGNVVAGLPFADHEFDQVLAPEILEHVDFDEAVKALRECARVGRRVLITIPNADKPDYDPDLVHNIEHRWLVNRQSVDRLLREAGCTNYELDVSAGLDFYLLDIRTDAPAPRALIHQRAAMLPTLELDPGQSLHVAVDASALEDETSRNRGIGRYMLNHFRELVALRPHWQFSICGRPRLPLVPEIEELAAPANCTYRVWSELAAAEPQLLYLPHPMGDFSRQLLQAAVDAPALLTACTFHDLVPLVMPDAYLRPNPAFQAQYLSQLRMLRERCDLFLCNSQCTAQDLQVHLHLPLERLRIIHAGVTDHFASAPEPSAVQQTLQRFGIESGRYLLFVGVPDPRKNALGMFFALSAARQVTGSDLKLVIAGDLPDFLLRDLRAAAAQCKLPDSAVVYTGFTSDRELAALYHSALALLFPSFYEGFGFPILEAMSAGLPVIAGDNSSQSEIAGDSALLVEPRDFEAIARAILALERDQTLRQSMAEKGRTQYRCFTWKKTAEKTAIYLAEFAARKGRDRHASPKPRAAALA